MLAFFLAAALAMFQMPASQTVNTISNLTISDVTPGTVIHYTTNGSTPTVDSPIYEHPINLNQTSTVQAFAVGPGDIGASPIASAKYTFVALPPVISNNSTDVTITTSSVGVKIFYTTNGSLPSANAAAYTGPFTVAAGTTIRAIAAQTGWTDSSVTSLKVNP